MRRPIRLIALLLAVMLVLAACTTVQQAPASQPATQPQTIVLKMASFSGPTYPIRVMLEAFKDEVEARSNGQVKFDYYPGESLVKITETWDAVRDGVIHIGLTSAAFQPDRLGVVAAIANMPWNWEQDKFAQHHRDPGGFMDYITPYFEKHGMKVMGWLSVGSGEIYCRQPVQKMEDLKGKLVRSVSSAFPGLRLLGAEPVDIPTAEVFDALQRGTIDCATLSVQGYLNGKLYEVAPHLTLSNFYTGSLIPVMEQKFFDSLPKDVQDLIMTVFMEQEKIFYDKLSADLKQFIQDARNNPQVQVFEVPAAEVERWKQTVAPMYGDLGKKFGAEWDKMFAILKTLQ